MVIRHGTWAAQVVAGLGVTSPLEARLAEAAKYAKDSTGKARAGVLWEGNPTLVTGTAGMAYSVAKCTLVQVVSLADGATTFPNDGVVSVATPAAPGSNSRVDIIYGWHRDFVRDGGNSDPVLAVASGNPAVSPVAPVLPAGAVEIARAVVAAGITATTAATISQTAKFTALAGAPIVYRNKAERDADFNVAGTLVAPQPVMRWDTKTLEVFNGSGFSAWAGSPLRESRTNINTGGNVGDNTTLHTVTIPAQPFAQRVKVDIDGLVSPSSAGTAGIAVSASGAGVTLAFNPTNSVFTNIGAQFYGYARKGTVSIPANVTCVITFKAASSVNSSYELTFETTVQAAGEF